MTRDGQLGALFRSRISRRAFLAWCGAMTAVLALPDRYVPRVAAAVSGAPRIPLIWLRGAGCGADGEALLHAADPTVTTLFLELLSVDYLETLMAPAGAGAAAVREATMQAFPNGYIAVVEGAIANADDGTFHTLGGRPFRGVARQVCGGALATIAVGSCAFDGGLAGAGGGAIGAGGVPDVTGGRPFLTLPGCPVNAANLAATIVHFLTFGELPPADPRGRPLFAYGSLIPNQCERRPHFEYGEFVEAWGDEGAQKGWCLYKMGCKGPESYANCPTTRYDGGTSWPIRPGQVCIACTMPGFWDSMGPVFRRLPPLAPFTPWLTADVAGQVLVGGTVGVAAAHGAASMVRARRRRRREAAAVTPAVVAVAAPPAEPRVPGPPSEAPLAAEPTFSVSASGVADAAPSPEVGPSPESGPSPEVGPSPQTDAPPTTEGPGTPGAEEPSR